MARTKSKKKKTIAMLTQALHRAPTEEEIKRSLCKGLGTRAKALHRPRTEEEIASRAVADSKKKTMAMLTNALHRAPTEEEITSGLALVRKLRALRRERATSLTPTKMIRKVGRVPTPAEVDVEAELEVKSWPVFNSMYSGPDWFQNKTWAQMSSTERTSALTLGWNERDFEDREDCDEDEDHRLREAALKVFDEPWDKLGKTKQKAAIDLGLKAADFGQIDNGIHKKKKPIIECGDV